MLSDYYPQPDNNLTLISIKRHIKQFILDNLLLIIMYGFTLIVLLVILFIWLINPMLFVILVNYPSEGWLMTIYIFLVCCHIVLLTLKLVKIFPITISQVVVHLLDTTVGIIYALAMVKDIFPNIQSNYHHMIYGLWFSLFFGQRGALIISWILGLLIINDEINNYNELDLWGTRESTYGIDNWIASYWWLFLSGAIISTIMEFVIPIIYKRYHFRNSINGDYQRLDISLQ